MSDLRFDWDPKKEKSNLEKHKVSFDEARTVFFDDDARVISDPEHSESEDRFIIIGLSRSAKVLVVVHCYRQDESLIRIISARKGTKKEEQQYWRQKQ